MHAPNDQNVVHSAFTPPDALRASETRYRTLATAGADVIYRMSPDWSEVQELDAHGIQSDTPHPPGSWLSRYILPEDRLHVMAVIDHAVRSKIPFEMEHRVVRADGTPGWTMSRAVPVLDANGQIVEWIGTATDVTERKRTEQHLRNSDERFRSVSESGLVAICFFDETGAIIEANDAFRDMFHATRDDVSSGALSTNTITADASLARSQLAFDEYHRTGVITPYEKEYVRPDDTRFWALVAGRRMTSGQGVGFVIDIDERKRTEQRETMLADISRELVGSLDVATMMERLCEKIGRHFGVKWCAFAEVGAGIDDAVVAHQWNDADVAPLARSYRWLDYGSLKTITAHAPGEPRVMHDTRSEPGADRYAVLDVRAFISLPLFRDDHWRMQVWISDTKPRKWSDADVALLRELADRIWLRLERARADQALRETQARLEEALTTARMAYWTWDPRTESTVASRSMDELFGLRDGETLSSRAQRFQIVHPDDRKRHRDLVERAAARGEGWHTEFRVIRPRDGELAWLEERATVARDPASGAMHTTGLVWDVTDRKRAEAVAELERRALERDAMRRALASAEESERRRLARDLHDQLGQHLTALMLGLGEARRLLDAGQPAQARLTQLEDLARLMTRDARYLALQLRPPELDDVGLESALHSYVDQWSARYGVSAEVAVAGAGASRLLPSDVSAAVYRIAQEALTNVAKHAEAQQVSVLLERAEREVRLIIEDDGRGFDLDVIGETARRKGSIGLESMRERVALISGTLEVESSLGRGTTIYVRAPVPPAPTSEEE